MALDIPSVPAVGQTLKYIRAAYDFNREGGDPGGPYSVPSQQLPAGAIVVAVGHQTVDPVTDVGSTVVHVWLGTLQLDQALTPQAYGASFYALGNNALPAAAASLPVSLVVYGDGFLAGSFIVYVYYV